MSDTKEAGHLRTPVADDDRHGRDIGQLVSFGLAAMGVAIIAQLASIQTLSFALSVSVYCFSISIPLLVMSGLSLHPSANLPSEKIDDRWGVFIAYVVGVVSATLGVVAIIFHFGWPYGIVFLVACAAAVCLMRLRWKRAA